MAASVICKATFNKPHQRRSQPCLAAPRRAAGARWYQLIDEAEGLVAPAPTGLACKGAEPLRPTRSSWGLPALIHCAKCRQVTLRSSSRTCRRHWAASAQNQNSQCVSPGGPVGRRGALQGTLQSKSSQASQRQLKLACCGDLGIRVVFFAQQPLPFRHTLAACQQFVRFSRTAHGHCASCVIERNGCRLLFAPRVLELAEDIWASRLLLRP